MRSSPTGTRRARSLSTVLVLFGALAGLLGGCVIPNSTTVGEEEQQGDSSIFSGIGTKLDESKLPAAAKPYVKDINDAAAKCSAFPAPVIAAIIDKTSGWSISTSKTPIAQAAFEDVSDVAWEEAKPADLIAALGQWLCDKHSDAQGDVSDTVETCDDDGTKTDDPLFLTMYWYHLMNVQGKDETPDCIKPAGGFDTFMEQLLAKAKEWHDPASIPEAGGAPGPITGSNVAEKIVNAGKQVVGMGLYYEWGGGHGCAQPDPKPCNSGMQMPEQGVPDVVGLDCSGFIRYAVWLAGKSEGKDFDLDGTVTGQVSLARQWKGKISIVQEYGSGKMSTWQPGDLVAIGDYHTVMYIGNNKILHAPSPGKPLTEADGSYLSSKSVFVYRVMNFG